MDSNIDSIEKLKSRDKILNTLVDRLNGWDKTAETGIDIIEKNKTDIENLKSMEATLKRNHSLYSSDGSLEYMEKINYLLEGEKNILDALLKKSEEVELVMKQLNNRDKIKDNYLSQNKNSIFIDRDF